MVDTDGMDFGSRFWMHKKHFLSVQSFRLARLFEANTRYQLVHQDLHEINCKHYKTLRCPPCYSNTFFQKISIPQRYQTCKPNFNQLYGSSSLIGFNHMIQELKHELLESSKQLPNIKLSKTVIYKSMQVFSNIPSTTRSISISNQAHIYETTQTLSKQYSNENKRVLL